MGRRPKAPPPLRPEEVQAAEVKRARENGYAVGYAAGSKGAWPTHRPPLPPDRLIREMMAALQALADAADAWVATFPEDDEDVQKMVPGINAAYTASQNVGAWLTAREEDV